MNKKIPQVSVLLHDIRSVHNVGSIFRTSDALGVEKIYLSGYTPAPTDRFGRARNDLAKVALGAEKSVPWQTVSSARTLIKKLKKEGYTIIALEQDTRAIDYKKVRLSEKNLYIVGSEVTGVSQEILALCDVIADIPMRGEKESLNVSVAFGVGLFRMLSL
jgi:tRNA G18 (ribose-2'-O)-methylase SpoU